MPVLSLPVAASIDTWDHTQTKQVSLVTENFSVLFFLDDDIIPLNILTVTKIIKS
jgi:hypothetical protein